MIVIVHENAKKVKFLIRGEDTVSIKSQDLVKQFWELAKDFPQELILWVDQVFYENINIEDIDEIFHHKLIMSSYPVRNQYLPETIGYIDQLPFINPNHKVNYPTWLMSTDVGGMYGETALAFKKLLGKINDFGYLINSIAKIGQQNSLFCYSDPLLVRNYKKVDDLYFSAGRKELFQFVYQFYNSPWIFVLFFCFIRYESKFPLLSFFTCIFSSRHFGKRIDLSNIEVSSTKNDNFRSLENIDVIIPTLDRHEYVKQILKDLSNQSLLPKRVIVVEQDPLPDSKSQLLDVRDAEWPFELIHIFVNKAGACFARNKALLEVKSSWVFFADDDIRIEPGLLEKALSEISRLGIHVLNMNCVQPEGKTVFQKIKQWGAFGSGTAIVSAEYALQCRFSEVYEYGFGEDTDFGLQLRSKGADVIYHPDVKITHLKAERGGFRSVPSMPWKNGSLTPKPSPTMMLLVKSRFNQWMMKGYKVSLFIKFYKRQNIKNPYKYFTRMKKRWKISEDWAKELVIKSSQD